MAQSEITELKKNIVYH